MALFVVFFVLGSVLQINGQFPNFFSAMMGGSNTGNGSHCVNSAVSCMPWCQRSMDSKGCPVCNCQTGGGGLTPGGVNFGGVNPAGMNPMAGLMFGGLSGGQSPMGGVSQQPSDCPAAPRTCPYPPPWCQRLVDEKQCVKCLCGQDLINFQKTLNGQLMAETTTNKSQSLSSLPSSSPPTTSTTTSTSYSPTQSCLLTFTCPKMCGYGYKTDSSGCPLCECIDGGMVDVTVAGTDPPGKPHTITPGTTTSHMTTDVISCPGLFSCAVICNNGYKTDDLGCPKCECVV